MQCVSCAPAPKWASGRSAIYSDADRHALHVKKADEAYNIGSRSGGIGYLNAHNLVNLAVATGCDALHPGYGFLSENPVLARNLRQTGIIFIGPSAEVIRQMGDKIEARKAMMAAGIPVIPGSERQSGKCGGSLRTGQEHRLSGHAQGHHRRRRARDSALQEPRKN